MRDIQQKKASEMTLALAERYSSLSFRDCLRPEEKARNDGLDPLVDLPLLSSNDRSFAVPPGIEVGLIWGAHSTNQIFVLICSAHPSLLNS